MSFIYLFSPSVERIGGTFGNVTVFWRALFVNSLTGVTTPAVAQTDIDVPADSFTFSEGQMTEDFTITILSDGIPELEELYMIELLNTSGSVPGAVISSGNDSSTLVIAENESPYGVFSWSESDLTWLAEDIPVSDTTNGTGYFNVTRSGGTFGTIQVRLNNCSVCVCIYYVLVGSVCYVMVGEGHIHTEVEAR